MVRALAVEASGNSISKMAGCVLLLLTGKASGKLWWRKAWCGPWTSRPAGHPPRDSGVRSTSLGWQGKWQTVVEGGKASSGSITRVADLRPVDFKSKLRLLNNLTNE